MINKVVLVETHNLPIKVDMNEEIFSSKRTFIDSGVEGDNSLETELQKALDGLTSEGYSILSIVPITSGGHGYTSGPFGFSYTSSLLIVAQKKE